MRFPPSAICFLLLSLSHVLWHARAAGCLNGRVRRWGAGAVGWGSARGSCCVVAPVFVSFCIIFSFWKEREKKKMNDIYMIWAFLLLLLAQAAAALARTLRGGAATFFSDLLQPLKHVHADVLLGAWCRMCAWCGGCEDIWAVYYITTDPMIARGWVHWIAHYFTRWLQSQLRHRLQRCRRAVIVYYTPNDQWQYSLWRGRFP